jgi:hypothetical protein
MSKEYLEKLKVNELVKICKENGIVHYKGKVRFKKAEMVEAILNLQKQTANNKSNSNVIVVVEKKIENTNANSAVEKENKTAVSNSDNNNKPFFDKEVYLNNLKLGTLIAFREYSGRLNTAAVQNVSYKRKQIKLITQYQKEFIINFDDVVWIRTGKRWPKFVMNELKGGERNAVK